MGVVVIYIVFLALLCVLIIVSTYFVSSLVSRRAHQRRLDKQVARIRPMLNRHMLAEDPADISDRQIERIRKLSLTRIGLEAFTQCYREYVQTHGYSERLRRYAGRVVDYKTLMKNRIVRDQYRASYVLYLLAEYHVHNPEVDELAIRSLDAKSLYTRNNALQVIKNTGDVDLVIRALEAISASEHYFNSKMVIDFFDTFIGDQELLVQRLLDDFDNFSLFIRRLLPGHFTNQRTDNAQVRQLMLRCLGGEDKELIIAASKYFGWVTEPEAGEVILQNMDHPDWEVRALSARVSQRGYQSPEMLDALERRLSDGNWYVRMNSAFAFVAMAEDPDRVQRVIQGADRYAREITLYVMFVKNMIDYEEYTQMVGEEQAAGAGDATNGQQLIPTPG